MELLAFVLMLVVSTAILLLFPLAQARGWVPDLARWPWGRLLRRHLTARLAVWLAITAVCAVPLVAFDVPGIYVLAFYSPSMVLLNLLTNPAARQRRTLRTSRAPATQRRAHSAHG